MRYSRRTGPSVDFAVTDSVEVIPGLSITRSWDDGEVLVLGHARYLNQTGAGATYELSINVDGSSPLAQGARANVPNLSWQTLTLAMLLRLTAGPHTIDLRAAGSGSAGDVIEADGAALSVIQLPAWDSDADIL